VQRVDVVEEGREVELALGTVVWVCGVVPSGFTVEAV